jgi:hypothetical protein
MKEIKEPPKLLYRNQLVLKPNDIIPQVGMQEAALMASPDLLIVGGSRGGGKTHLLILDPLYDTHNPHFTAIFFRKETGELTKGGGLYDKASKIYLYLGAKGTQLKQTFPSGAMVTYDHIQNEQEREVEKRFKGLEVPAFYIDEIDQFLFPTVTKLMQSNRNSVGIRNRIIGTCNPNPNSWLRIFLDWYIGEDGLIVPSRDRVVRYFYIYGTTVNDIIWGDTRENVYDQAKHYIDKSWNEKFTESGITKLDSIKSFQFIRGDLSENKILLKSQPTYYANVSQGGASAIARNLEGNWNVKEDGDELVTRSQMTAMFDEYRVPLRSGKKYLTIDVALLGLDKFVAVSWDGWHIEKVRAKARLDSAQAIEFVSNILHEDGIPEENMAYDNVGNGQALTCFKRALPINAQAAAIGKENAYDNLKSQIMYNFAKTVIEGGITCSQQAANAMFDYGTGTKKEKMSFNDILQNERRALMMADSAGKTKMINKKEMKRILGQSPDFVEGTAYRTVFDLDKKKKGSFQGLEWL